jgi:hypothetical protein
MKVLNPSGVTPPVPQPTEKQKALIQDAIIQSGTNLSILVNEIFVSFPQRLDDFDPMGFKVIWRGKLGGMPPEWKGKPDIGGRLFWPTMPTDEQLKIATIRSTSFAILIGILPERNFVYSALDAFKFNQEFLAVGVYLQECIHLLNSSVSTIPPKNGGKPKHALPSLAKVQQTLISHIQQKAMPLLKSIHEKMKADLVRQDKEDDESSLPHD